ncbi:MAG: sugar ABC transporter substrate-binding protein [Planctomycetaceae bacterium]|nr:sugar ABC transporter substrate-binding protein [Planctomycetaceae bacterium]
MPLSRVLLLVFFVSWGLAGCSGQDAAGPKSPSGGGAAGAKKKYRIAVIPKGTTHEFWKSVHAGADNAAKELGNVEIIWKGSHLEDDRDGQISVVQDFTTQRVDGICLAPLDSQALGPFVKEAKQEQIPTVIFDSALDDESSIVSYVATDNYNGGVLAARQLSETLDGKGGVILLRYNPGSESTNQREEGFLATLKAEFPGITVLTSDEYAGTTENSALDKAQQLLIKFRGKVDGIFAVCEPNSTGLLKALELEGLAGKVKFVGFDPSPHLVESLRQKKLHGIVLQDPVKMGYQAVMTLMQHIRGETVEKRISTGEYVATPLNMDEPAMKKLLNPQQFGE